MLSVGFRAERRIKPLCVEGEDEDILEWERLRGLTPVVGVRKRFVGVLSRVVACIDLECRGRVCFEARLGDDITTGKVEIVTPQ
jgi:hypothetical protein